MAFQTRGVPRELPKSPSSAPTGASPSAASSFSSSLISDPSLSGLVDQIAEAVRGRLLSQGVPLAADPVRAVANASSWIHEADRIGNGGESPFQPHILAGNDGLAQKIDHTLLKPDATKEEIQRVCEEARKYGFATVCVNSSHVGMAAQLLKGSITKAIAVVGFPLGAAATATKAFEARESVRLGAQEIDMVINIGALKSRDYTVVLDDIRQVVEASRPYGVKVILETSSLTDDEKIIGCALSKAAGAAFVKTSTGFASGGATAEDIALMRRVVGPEMGVKASGGIRTYEDAAKMLAAGASRIGASASIAIVLKTASKPGVPKGAEAAKKPFKSSLY